MRTQGRVQVFDLTKEDVQKRQSEYQEANLRLLNEVDEAVKAQGRLIMRLILQQGTTNREQ